jgi:hypothetical protein
MHTCVSVFKQALRGFVLACCFGLGQSVQAAIELLHLADYQSQQQLLIDAQARIELPEAIVQAIEHEIPLRFITEVALVREHNLLLLPFMHEQVRIDYTTQISYSRFYQRYTLHNLRNHNRQQVASLAQALDLLGTLNGFQLASLAQLHPGARYHIRLRFRLEYWTLPAPMLTQALLDARWRLSSRWFDLALENPF